jgi:ATP-dependent Clp protease ATP-binding subunit ClpC
MLLNTFFVQLAIVAVIGLVLNFSFRRRPDREAAMYERFTDRARKVMQVANLEASSFNHEYVGTEHMLLGLIKEGSGVAANVLKNLDIDLLKVRLEIEKIVQTGPGGEQVVLGKLPMTPRAKKVIEYSVEEARNLNHNYVGTEHLLLGLLREQEAVAAQVLMNLGLNLDRVREEVLNLLGHNVPESPAENVATETGPGLSGPWESIPLKPNKNPRETPTLDKVALNLTALASTSNLSPLIGRHAELRSLIEVLACRDRNSALVLGELGVGKVTLVTGLAQAIANGSTPEWLRSHRVLELGLVHFWDVHDHDSARLARTRSIFREARKSSETVFVFPDMIEALGRMGGGLELRRLNAELLLTLREDRVPCILIASPSEYRRYVSRRGSLDELIQPVRLPPASLEETVAVLAGVRDQYATYHGTQIPDEILKTIAEAADRRLPGALPGKAVHLLDRCAVRTRIQKVALSHDEAAVVRNTDEQITRLNQEKDEAVAEQDFPCAAELRSQVDTLKKSRELLLQGRTRDAIVDGAVVEEVIRDLANDESFGGSASA